MKALKISGVIRLVDADNSPRGICAALNCAHYSTHGLRDGAVMLTDADAEAKGLPYNQLASLIAEAGVYGTALIVGADEDEFYDVPECYLSMLGLNDGLKE